MGIVKKAVSFLTSPLSLVSKKLGKVVQGAFLIAAGVVTGNPGLIMMGIGRVASALQKSPKVSNATGDRLLATLDPATPRKIVFGRTAMATDVRYHAYTGANQEYYEQILCVASHKVEAVEEIWFDTELAWSAAGGVTAKFAGYLTVAVKLEGSAANTVAIDANWGAAQRLTGCAYLHLKYKLTGNVKNTQSPFQTIPSRVTVRGKGAFVPDPRLSTGAGGSGAQNMADQSTWAYTTAADSGRNPACQTLFYLLGWKINGKLAVALGAPSARIDFASFITGANICDESVVKAGGGTEPRYRSDGIFSEDDDPDTVLTSLLQAMNAELTDSGGKIGLRIDFNDLASPAVALSHDDILDGDDWRPTAASEDQNIVRGRYTDPSDGALYQLVDYPQVALAGADYGSPDGIQRIDSFDLPCVQSPSQAQRLAKLRLQRKQYPGVFTARFTMKAWGAGYGKIVTLTHASLGFAAKKFRVAGQTIRQQDGSVDLVLREVDAAQYSWTAEEAAVVAAAAPTAYNPLNHPLVAFADSAGALATLNNVKLGTGTGGVFQSDGSTMVTDATGITSLGTSAFVANQAAIATDPDAIARILAMRGDNVIRNGGFTEGQTGYTLGAGVVYAAFGAGYEASYAIAVPNGGTNSYAYANSGSAVPYTAHFAYFSASFWPSGLSAAFTFAAVCLDSAGGGVGSASANITTSSAAAGFEVHEVALALPAGTAQVQLFIQRPGTIARDQYFTNLRFAPTARGADVTAQQQIAATPALDQTVYYDYTGAPKTGQLTRPLTNYLKKGGADVSSGATWTFTPSGCTVSAGSNGVVTLNTVTATNAALFVKATYGGKDYTWTIQITKVQDDPPAGGATATFFTGGASGNVNQSSYATPVIIGIGTMLSNASGQARLSANVDYQETGIGASNSVDLKWQRSPAGAGTWTDTGISATGTTSVGPSGALDDFGTAGSAVTGSSMATGMSANTAYDFRLIAKYNTSAITVSGTVAGAQS